MTSLVPRCLLQNRQVEYMGEEYRVQSPEYRVQNSECRVQSALRGSGEQKAGSGHGRRDCRAAVTVGISWLSQVEYMGEEYRVQSREYRVQNSECRVQSAKCRVC